MANCRKYQCALEIRDHEFGVNHIDSAVGIGNVYAHKGKYNETIAHYEWALSLQEGIRSESHQYCQHDKQPEQH
jgi:hypothetical protein